MKYNSLISLISGILFGIVSFGFGEPGFACFAYGVFFGLLLEILLSTYRSPDNNEKIDKITKILANSRGFVETLVKNKNRVNEVEGHLFARKDYVKNIGANIWSSYLDKFLINENGIYLGGEELALRSYIKVMKFLVEKQRIIGNNDKKKLIARVTHSNDISIWLPESQPLANEFYAYQKEFIKSGGIFIRIIIGKKEIANKKNQDGKNDYERAMDVMKSHGVKTCYFDVDEVGEKDYDFMLLYDESFELKWYAGVSGQRLAGFFMSDKVEEEVIDRWHSLYKLAEEKGCAGDFGIPDGRHIKM